MAYSPDVGVSVNAPAAPPPAPTAPSQHTYNPPGAPLYPYGPLSSDPGVVAAQAAQARAKAQADALLRQQRAQALIQFGDPSLMHGLGFAADPSVLAAAKANQYSFVNQLHLSDADRRRQMLNSLAARGILHSGETGYQSGQEDKWFGQNLYGAEQSLLANLSGYLQNYLGTTNNASDAFNQALSQAYATYAANPDPKIYGNWTGGTLTSGQPAPVLPTGPQSPYAYPGTGESLIGLFK